MAIAGGMLIFGGELNDFARRLMYIVLVAGILLGASQIVGLFGATGASIGARAVCVAPVTIGRWSMVAAGATVVRDVPDFALMVGVPARRIGWVGRAGVPLERSGDDWICPQSGARYMQVSDNELKEL